MCRRAHRIVSPAECRHRISRTVGIVTEGRGAFFTTLGVLTNDGGTAARGGRRLGGDRGHRGRLVHLGEHDMRVFSKTFCAGK